MVWWVGGEMEIKANLSQSLTEVEAELGNIAKARRVSKRICLYQVEIFMKKYLIISDLYRALKITMIPPSYSSMKESF